MSSMVEALAYSSTEIRIGTEGKNRAEQPALICRKVSFGDVTVVDCISEVFVDDFENVVDMHLGIHDPLSAKHRTALTMYEQQRAMEGRSEGKIYSREGRMNQKNKISIVKLGQYCKYRDSNVYDNDTVMDEEPPERPRTRSIFVAQSPQISEDKFPVIFEDILDFPDCNKKESGAILEDVPQSAPKKRRPGRCSLS